MNFPFYIEAITTDRMLIVHTYGAANMASAVLDYTEDYNRNHVEKIIMITRCECLANLNEVFELYKK